MKRFKNILYVVGHGGAEEQLTASRVQALARDNNARVEIVHILEKKITDFFTGFGGRNSQDYSKIAREQLQENLDVMQRSSSWIGIAVSSRVVEGRDFIAIIQKVLKDKHDLVILAGLDNPDRKQLVMRLFRKCPCPVWVIRSSRGNDFKYVLAALDLSNDREENRLLNRKIIELADSMAIREGAEAHYVHALSLEFEGMMRGPRFNIGDDEIRAMKQDMHDASEQTLKKLFAETGISADPGRIHLKEGETSEVIQKTIANLTIDILVMGTVARSGVPGLLIGNKAEKVLSRVACTVLAVKPDGFVSPVKI